MNLCKGVMQPSGAHFRGSVSRVVPVVNSDEFPHLARNFFGRTVLVRGVSTKGAIWSVLVLALLKTFP